MIYQIDNDYENQQLKIEPNVNSQAYLRINGLYKAYGTGYVFINFFSNSSNNLFICIKEGFADIYIDKSTFNLENYEELKSFLYLKCSEILTEIPLNSSDSIDILTIETGKIFIQNIKDSNAKISIPISGKVSLVDSDIIISNETADCYKVAKEIFPNAINDKTYEIWYTDLSHRVRHKMSVVYTIDKKSVAMAYAFEENVVLISYLGTIESYRNQGYAKFLLNHIAKDLNATKLILQSQDELSDKFYENLGFLEDGNYYNYKLM